MPGPDFLDTNVLIYAYDPTDSRKQRLAQDLVKRAVAGEALISSQVLAEFSTVLLHKISPPASPDDLLTLLDALGPIRLVPIDGDVVRRAVQVRSQYGLRLYDGMIIAAAERGRCERIWSEDLNSGQKYFGVTVQNPFA